jgi:PPK2 family polyphosphate:nucleotide phosphotransferase
MGGKYAAQLRVRPGARIDLDRIDPSFHGSHATRKKAAPHIKQALRELRELQYRMWAEREHSLLVVLQGMDSAGKDGVIRHVFTGMNPQGCSVAHFAEPTPKERAHDFLWRVHRQVPGRGMVAIFNRSHYEDVLAARVRKLVPKRLWEKRYREINDFERLLTEQNGTTILKFFLHISKEEQLERFAKRLDDPSRRWKISEADYAQRTHWSEYQRAYEEVFRQTSTDLAPWFIIPSNHKWFCRLAVSSILVETMTAMNIKLPKPSVNLKDIRRKYHAAAETAPA